MKNRLIFIIIPIILISILSCTLKNSPVKNKHSADVSGVYIVGYNGSNAGFWHNGKLSVLPKKGKYAEATAIAISSSNVYVAGIDTNKEVIDDAVYWRNGKRFVLPKSHRDARASAIEINGSDFYIVGNDGTWEDRDAIYWLNGKRFALPQVNIYSVAYAIAISGYDIYIVGSDGFNAVYWLNSKRFELQSKPTYSFLIPFATDIAISGSDVYIVGYYSYFGENYPVEQDSVYWRNGEYFVLPRLGIKTFVEGIAVSGFDVYIVGRDIYGDDKIDAVYWLNGERFVLPKTSERAYAIDIAISGNDVYIAGRDSDNTVLWLNGEFMTTVEGVAYPSAITVVP